MGGFYRALSQPAASSGNAALYGLAAGAAIGAASGLMGQREKKQAQNQHQTVTVDDLQREEDS